jgi:hypothetical protein
MMLLVIIVALSAALVDQQRRWAAHLIELELNAKRVRAQFSIRAAEYAKLAAKLAETQAIRCVESEGYRVSPDELPTIREDRDGWIVSIQTLPPRIDGHRSVRVDRGWRATLQHDPRELE